MFIRKSRMEEAFKKHIEKMSKAKCKFENHDFIARQEKNSTKIIKTSRVMNIKKSPPMPRKKGAQKTYRKYEKPKRRVHDKTMDEKDFNALNQSKDASHPYREFTSFGSKVATTESTSKRSSNDVENVNCSNLKNNDKND